MQSPQKIASCSRFIWFYSHSPYLNHNFTGLNADCEVRERANELSFVLSVLRCVVRQYHSAETLVWVRSKPETDHKNSESNCCRNNNNGKILPVNSCLIELKRYSTSTASVRTGQCVKRSPLINYTIQWFSDAQIDSHHFRMLVPHSMILFSLSLSVSHSLYLSIIVVAGPNRHIGI